MEKDNPFILSELDVSEILDFCKKLRLPPELAKWISELRPGKPISLRYVISLILKTMGAAAAKAAEAAAIHEISLKDMPRDESHEYWLLRTMFDDALRSYQSKMVTEQIITQEQAVLALERAAAKKGCNDWEV